jgi:hypothetical protein
MFSDDVRQAARRIRSKPATVIGAATMLALAIALTTAMFTLADVLLLRPMQFDSDTLPGGVSAPMAFVRLTGSMPAADALRLATTAAHDADAATAKLAAKAEPLAGLVLDPYYQRALPLLFGGVALVFLVLCANASSLLLVRVGERRREFSMCAALGASRARLLRQAIVEGVMLGAIDGGGSFRHHRRRLMAGMVGHAGHLGRVAQNR